MNRRFQLSRAAAAMLAAAMLSVFGTSADAGTKYAVIVVGESIDVSDISSDTPQAFAFWNGGVLAYEMLLENGFNRDNIFVLYGNGQDFNGSHNAIMNRSMDLLHPMTDMKASAETIRATLQCLSNGFTDAAVGCATVPLLTDEDFLVLFWTSHGFDPSYYDDPPPGCQESGDVAFRVEAPVGEPGVDVCASEIASWMSGMDYRRRVLVFTTCRSGGIIPHFEPHGSNTVLMPACFAAEAEDAGFPVDLVGSVAVYAKDLPLANGSLVPQFHWTHWVAHALRELRPLAVTSDPDGDSNSLVSIGEANTWARERAGDVDFDWTPLAPMPPAIVDPDHVADCLFIRAEMPGTDVEVFSRDHPRDDSTVPSNSEPWYHGPDLWVSTDPGGVTGLSIPRYGEANYVFARVHNIGCADLSDVTVELAWSYPSGWMDKNSWFPIGTAGPVSIAKATSATLPPVTWTDVPLPGSYCLHSTLHHADDPSTTTNWIAYEDNNKVQVNISVLGAVLGSEASAFFFIENPTQGTETIDLEFDLSSIPEGVELRVELPPETGISGLSGSVSKVSQDGWTVLDLTATHIHHPTAGDRTARVTGIRVPAESRMRALLSFGLMDVPASSQPVEFTFKQLVEDQDVGGIRFVLNVVANPQTLLCEVARNEVGVFRELAHRLEQPVFQHLADRIEHHGQLICGTLAALRQTSVADEGDRNALLGSLISVSEVYGARFANADQHLRNSIGSGNLGAAVSAAQARLMYAAIVLDELEEQP